MGLKVNIVVFVVTILMTVATTGFMSLAIMSEHWEVVQYDVSKLRGIVARKSHLLSVENLYDGKVVLIRNGNQSIDQVMIQMHAGLWAVCYDLRGT